MGSRTTAPVGDGIVDLQKAPRLSYESAGPWRPAMRPLLLSIGEIFAAASYDFRRLSYRRLLHG
jgi:hypothetical protein